MTSNMWAERNVKKKKKKTKMQGDMLETIRNLDVEMYESINGIPAGKEPSKTLAAAKAPIGQTEG